MGSAAKSLTPLEVVSKRSVQVIGICSLCAAFTLNYLWVESGRRREEQLLRADLSQARKLNDELILKVSELKAENSTLKKRLLDIMRERTRWW